MIELLVLLTIIIFNSQISSVYQGFLVCFLGTGIVGSYDPYHEEKGKICTLFTIILLTVIVLVQGIK